MSKIGTILKAVSAVRGSLRLLGTDKERSKQLHSYEKKLSRYILNSDSDFTPYQHKWIDLDDYFNKRQSRESRYFLDDDDSTNDDIFIDLSKLK